VVDEEETKHNTTQLATTNGHNSGLEGDSFHLLCKRNSDKLKENSAQGILKQKESTKQKKKLEKKAAAVSKYISFYQQSKEAKNDLSAPEMSCSVV
jgi:hypothetical protein